MNPGRHENPSNKKKQRQHPSSLPPIHPPTNRRGMNLDMVSLNLLPPQQPRSRKKQPVGFSTLPSTSFYLFIYLSFPHTHTHTLSPTGKQQRLNASPSKGFECQFKTRRFDWVYSEVSISGCQAWQQLCLASWAGEGEMGWMDSTTCPLLQSVLSSIYTTSG